MSFDAEYGAEGPVLWEEHGAWFTAEKDLELPLHQHSEWQTVGSWDIHLAAFRQRGEVPYPERLGAPVKGQAGDEYHQEQKKQCH